MRNMCFYKKFLVFLFSQFCVLLCTISTTLAADPVITSSSSASVAENSTTVLTVTATDEDVGDIINFSLTDGTDQGFFSLESESGALTFTSAPDFETPLDSDTNNIYVVQVTASDGNGGSDVQSITVTVTNVNEAPVITSLSSASVAENSTAVLTVTATDVDNGDTPTFSLSGGSDQGVFFLDIVSGVLTFTAAPNFEAPLDSDIDNIYVVQVTASDGNGGSDVQNITVSVTNVNEAPVITSLSSASVAENSTAVLTVTATDVDDGDTPTFSLSGGSDQGVFSLDIVSGVLTFTAAPNFEAPLDSDINNIYAVQVTASDGNGGSDVQDVTVTVTDINDAPVISSSASAIVPENSSTVLTVTATDDDSGDIPIFSLSGGADQGMFSLDSASGALTYITPPDFEIPLDSDTNNIYAVQVTASDGNGGSGVQDITVTVTNINEAPVITSLSSATVPENSTAILTVTATDVDSGDTPTFSLSGGVDQMRFALNNVSGVLTFSSAPDFETPLDSDADNIYAVQVTASDGNGGSAVQDILVTVTDANDDPVISSSSSATVPENSTTVLTVTATDDDSGDVSTFSLSGGADQGMFSLDSVSGVLTFTTAPDFETPLDNDTNNIYAVQVTAFDGNGGNGLQDIIVTVTDINDDPVISSSASASVPESSTTVLTVTATDEDSGDVPTFSLSGGADQSFFSLDNVSGILTFITAPDFETPLDIDTNNIYIVQVTAFDGKGGSAVQDITVTVTNVNENPVISSLSSASMPENSITVLTVTATDVDNGDIPTFSLSGGADQSLFSLDSVSGALTFTVAPNFETPLDSDTNNIYIVQVSAFDGNGGSDVQDITVTVTDINDDPVINSSSSASVPENSTTVLTVTATDDDSGHVPIFNLSGGADQGLFSLDSVSGVLTFTAAPDFETPMDNDINNIYVVQVTASDENGGSGVQDIVVTVTNVNEAPVITSLPSATIPENSTTVLTVAATDVDSGDTPTFSLSGGVDQAHFSLNSVSGDLTFNSAPDFEIPSDTDTNNIYEVQVTASDGNGGTAVQDILVTIIDANDAPVITSPSSASTPENSSALLTVTATDADSDIPTFSLSGGADQDFFSVDNVSGTLAFIIAPDFETPSDSGADNLYEVQVAASDGNGGNGLQDITVTVTDINDAPDLMDDAFGILEDALNSTLLVLLNDSDDDGDTLTITSVSSPDQGGAAAVNLTSDAVIYTPAVDYIGIETFTYTVDDGNGGISTATVTLTVDVAPDPPVADELIFSTEINTPFDNTLTGSDPNGNPISFVLETDAGLGAVTITDNSGPFHYEPDLYVTGIDNFVYRAYNGVAYSNPATGTVYIFEENFVPIAYNDTLYMIKDTILNGTLSMTDANPGGSHVFSIISNGTIGTAVITDLATGLFSYTPNAGVTGADTFTFMVNDGISDSNEATIAVNILDSADNEIIKLISSPGTGQSNANSYFPALSADGSYLTFTSFASNLVDGVWGGQVYLYDRMGKTIELVSLSDTGEQGNNTSDYPTINDDGQYLAFYSRASNLVAAEDTNPGTDIFVRDRQNGVTEVVSVSSTGEWADGASLYPSISNDGRYVAFESIAKNFVVNDSDTYSDIYVYDRLTDSIELVSITSSGVKSNRDCYRPSISQDGRYIAFHSAATTLVPGSTRPQIFVRDRQTGTITIVSVSSTGDIGDLVSSNPSISGDGRYVVFQSSSSNLVAGDTNDQSDVFVHDRLTGVTERISVSGSGAEGDGASNCYFQNSISADGQYIIFDSESTNLVIGDVNGVKDIFVHDRATGATKRISTAVFGEAGDKQSWWPSISADGQIKAFSSEATNLIGTDTNNIWDVFLVHPFNN